MNIEIPISVGELVDKLTILEIKKEKIQDTNKLININTSFLPIASNSAIGNIMKIGEKIDNKIK